VSLVDAAEPAAVLVSRRRPAACTLRWDHAGVGDALAVRGVFKNAAPLPDRCQGSMEAPAVVPGDLRGIPLREPVRPAGREAAPALTGRVCDHRPRTRIQPRIPPLVPGVDAGAVPINSAPLDEEGSDHATHHAPPPSPRPPWVRPRNSAHEWR